MAILRTKSVWTATSSRFHEMEPEAGAKIDVFWTLDSAWYSGTVGPLQTRGKNKGRRMIAYEDGEVEYLDFSKERWRSAVVNSRADKIPKCEKLSCLPHDTKRFETPSSICPRAPFTDHETPTIRPRACPSLGRSDHVAATKTNVNRGSITRQQISEEKRLSVSQPDWNRSERLKNEISAKGQFRELKLSVTNAGFPMARYERTGSSEVSSAQAKISRTSSEGVASVRCNEDNGQQDRGDLQKGTGIEKHNENVREVSKLPSDTIVVSLGKGGNSRVMCMGLTPQDQASTESKSARPELKNLAKENKGQKLAVSSELDVASSYETARGTIGATEPKIAPGTKGEVEFKPNMIFSSLQGRPREGQSDIAFSKRRKINASSTENLTVVKQQNECDKLEGIAGSTTTGTDPVRVEPSVTIPTEKVLQLEGIEGRNPEILRLERLVALQAEELKRLTNVEAKLKETQQLVAALQPNPDAISDTKFNPAEALQMLRSQKIRGPGAAGQSCPLRTDEGERTPVERQMRADLEIRPGFIPTLQTRTQTIAKHPQYDAVGVVQEIHAPTKARDDSSANDDLMDSTRNTQCEPEIPECGIGNEGAQKSSACLYVSHRRTEKKPAPFANSSIQFTRVTPEVGNVCDNVDSMQIEANHSDRDNSRRHEEGYNRCVVKPCGPPAVGAPPSPEFRGSSFAPGLGEGSISMSPQHANDMKFLARRLTARAATAWLLSGGYRGKIPVGIDPKSPTVPSWCVNTSAACLQGASTELAKHGSAEDADEYFATRFGSNTAELEWLSFPASSGGQSSSNPSTGSGEEYIARARKNYLAWDPKPSEEEWAVESMIMREVGRRYTKAFVGCIPGAGDTVLKLGIRIAATAAGSAGNPVVAALASQRQ